MPDRPLTAIVIGASARACAQSLLRANITPIAVDLFADRDLKQIARTLRCPVETYPEAIPDIIRTQLCDLPADVPVILTGAMENHTDMLREIQRHRPLYGGTPDAIEKARSYETLAHAAAAAGVDWLDAAPRFPSDTPTGELARHAEDWLMKPIRSSAGHGMLPFNAHKEIPEVHSPQQYYLQPLLSPGSGPMSALFTEVSGQIRLAGATYQIAGLKQFGARYGTQYVGNVFTTVAPQEAHAWGLIGQSIANQTGLSGVFGVDAMTWIKKVNGQYRKQISLLEINPRYTAGMETLELTLGCSVFDGCGGDSGLDPRITHFDPKVTPWGKAVVYAKNDCHVPDLLVSLPRENIADIPEPGDFVPGGRPICTVLTPSSRSLNYLDELHRLAQTVYTLCKT